MVSLSHAVHIVSLTKTVPQFPASFLRRPFIVLINSFAAPLPVLLCHSLCRKSKTKPNGKKPPAEEKKQYLEPEFTKVRVVDFDLKELVVLPREIDLNEWLASNSECTEHLQSMRWRSRNAT